MCSTDAGKEVKQKEEEGIRNRDRKIELREIRVRSCHKEKEQSPLLPRRGSVLHTDVHTDAIHNTGCL